MQTYEISVSDYNIMPLFTSELSKEGIKFKTTNISGSKHGLFINVYHNDTSRFEILCANKGITISKV